MSKSMHRGLVLGSLLLAGCGQTAVGPNPSTVTTGASTASKDSAVADFVIGEPVHFQNLTIFPVRSVVAKSDDRFLTLDEGLKAGTVEIREVGEMAVNAPNADPGEQATIGQNEPVRDPLAPPADDPFGAWGAGNDVNTLVVVNHSDKPLYLMPGEVIIGGSQDRTIGNELVIAPHSSPTRVPVFCVEHGRWGDKGAEETVSQLQSAGGRAVVASFAANRDVSLDKLAQEADQGKFVASVGQLGKSGRVAVQEAKDQSAVWEKVAETNTKSGVQPDSGSFTANYTASLTIRRLEPYIEHLQEPVAGLDRTVGVLVAINGKIESMDVFESTPLFQKLWPKLLKSYALDAANADESTEPKECTLAAARTFFAEALQANVASSNKEHGVALTKRDSQHVISFTSHVEADAAAAPAAMGGMGGVHFSGFAK